MSIVRSLSNSTAEPRVFTSINDPCTCVTAVAYECQCACKIILRGGFHIEEFEKRHFRRDRVRGSINGWEAPQLSAMHNMMSYCHKEIDHNDDGIGGCVDDVVMLQPNDGISLARKYMSPKSNKMLPIDDLDYVCRSTRERKCSKVQPLAKNDLSKMYGVVMNKYSLRDTGIQLTISWKHQKSESD